MAKINKYIIFAAAIFFVFLIAILFYEKPSKINKNFIVYDLNQVAINEKQQSVEIKSLPQKFNVQLSLSTNKNLFFGRSFGGFVKINGIEYIVYPKVKSSDINEQIIPFVRKDSYYNNIGTVKGFSTLSPVDFYLRYSKDFQYVEMSFVQNSNELKASKLKIYYPYLFGPAESFEDALRKYCKYTNTKLSEKSIKSAIEQYNKLNNKKK